MTTVTDATPVPQTHSPDTPETWVAHQLADCAGEVPVYNFRVQVRERAGDRWHTECSVRRKPTDTASSLFDRIDRECGRQNAFEVRVIATTRQSVTPLSTFPWPTDFIGQIDDESDSPPGSDSGTDALLRQAYRHNETMMQALMKVCGAQAGMFVTMQAQAKSQTDAAWHERVEMMAAMRDIHLERDARETQAKKWDALTAAGTTFAQAAAYKLTQGKVAPDAKANLLDTALIRFGETITDDQAEQLHKIFDRDQLAMLVSLTTKPADTVEKIREARAEADHEQAVANAKTERDAQK